MLLQRRDIMPAPIKSRDPAKPEPGFFRVRLIKGGPQVAARLFTPCPVDPEFGHHIDRSRHLLAEINGRLYGSTKMVWWVWLTGRRTTGPDFEYLTDLAGWCRNHDARDPMAKPHKAVDPRTMRPAF